ncbi:MAG: hypothetical protein NT150_03850 [Bacteroidetes bacterium]|nr:hypothetical protein [Bacteroidota bacterium]
MKFSILLLSVLLSLELSAQADLNALEDSLAALFEQIEARETDDAQKQNMNEVFKLTLHNALLLPTSFKHNFKKLKGISILHSPDNKFKIFTWGFGTSDGVYHYFGFTQFHNKKAKRMIIRELQDKVASPDEFSQYSDSTWYGAVYYEIVPVKKKSDTCYILFGWDGNNWMSKKRIIEVVSFNHEGKIRFGNTIFKEKEEEVIKVKKSKMPVLTKKKEVLPGREKQRIVFEYAAKAAMSLHYNKSMNMIVFDHLAPSDPMYTNMFMFYAPDFSYDGYYYKNNKWYLRRNIDARSSKIIKAQTYTPQDDEDVKLKKTKFRRN